MFPHKNMFQTCGGNAFIMGVPPLLLALEVVLKLHNSFV